MGEQRPGGWMLEPNAAVVDAALAGDELATVEACRRGCGPEVIHQLRNRLFEFEVQADGEVPAPASPQRPQADGLASELRGLACVLRLDGVYRKGAEFAEEAADELDRLRRWKAEAMVVLGEWDKVHEALGSPGCLGESTAAASLDVIQSAAALPVRAQRPQASEAVDRLDGWLRATHDGSCRICGMGSEYVDQHAADCEAAPVIALALAAAAALPVRGRADDDTAALAAIVGDLWDYPDGITQPAAYRDRLMERFGAEVVAVWDRLRDGCGDETEADRWHLADPDASAPVRDRAEHADLIEAVRAADAELERTYAARQHAGRADAAALNARVALAEAVLAAADPGAGEPT